MRTLDPDLLEATEVARSLVGQAVEVARFAGGGRNSRIWRVRSGDREFALKQYPGRRHGARDRLGTEIGALRLMERYHIDAVPHIIGSDSDRGYVLLSWIKGSDVLTITDADVDAAVIFLGAIHALRNTPSALEQPLAAEACLSGAEIERQIEARSGQLVAAAAEDELVEFISHSFAPAFMSWGSRAREKIAVAGLDFAAEVPQECRSLVPADFGFHNSLRRGDGSLAFFDFEYFGWDDPVKLTADILLHPGRALLPAQFARFRNAALALYGEEDPAFSGRLSAYLPLFCLRWVLILLNEFVPERWHRRVLAGEAASWGDVKARQLARAHEFLALLPEKLGD